MNIIQKAYFNGFVKRAAEYGITQQEAIKLLKYAQDDLSNNNNISPIKHFLDAKYPVFAEPTPTREKKIYETIGKKEDDFLNWYNNQAVRDLPYWNSINALHPYRALNPVGETTKKLVNTKVVKPTVNKIDKFLDTPLPENQEHLNENQVLKGEATVEGVKNILSNLPASALGRLYFKNKFNKNRGFVDSAYHGSMLAHKSGKTDTEGNTDIDPRVLNNHLIGTIGNLGIQGLNTAKPYISTILPKKLKIFSKPIGWGINSLNYGSEAANLGISGANIYMGLPQGQKTNPSKASPKNPSNIPFYTSNTDNNIPPYTY